MNEGQQLSRVFETLGASTAQAQAMAAQLLKRADQQAQERGLSREAALARLLDLVIKGRSGEVPPEFAPPPPPGAEPR
jgi:hypothetical protein